jgi:hypothetical protein
MPQFPVNILPISFFRTAFGHHLRYQSLRKRPPPPLPRIVSSPRLSLHLVEPRSLCTKMRADDSSSLRLFTHGISMAPPPTYRCFIATQHKRIHRTLTTHRGVVQALLACLKKAKMNCKPSAQFVSLYCISFEFVVRVH